MWFFVAAIRPAIMVPCPLSSRTAFKPLRWVVLLLSVKKDLPAAHTSFRSG
jgi:hypothetical protein